MTFTSVKTDAGTVSFCRVSSHHIHVCLNAVRKAVLICDEDISCYCVEVTPCDDGGLSDSWVLWLGSDTGRLYCIHSSVLPHGGKSDDNQDIFNTLLASQAPGQQKAAKQRRSSQRIIRVVPKDAKLQLSGPILCISSLPGLLCVCFSAGQLYTLAVYTSHPVICNTDNGTVEPVWTQQLSADSQRYTDLQTPHVDSYTQSPPAVFLISSSSLSSRDEDNSALYTELFSDIFGGESIVMDTTVVIFGSPSGVVFYFKLKNLQPSAGQTPHILCSISQPVRTIQTFTVLCKGRSDSLTASQSFLASSQSEMSSTVACMAVIGQGGKCLLIFQSGDLLQYQTVILPGPIVSAVTVANVLYIATPKDLFGCRLSHLDKQDSTQKTFEVNVCSLGYCGVFGICGIPGSTLDSTLLYCVSQHGRVYTVLDEGQERPNKAVPGTQMKDLLLAIGRTNDDMDRVKSVISTQNQVLSQMSIASRLASLTSGTAAEKAAKTRKLRKIVKVKVSVKNHCLGSRRDFSIHMRLTNESAADLSCDWSVMVRVDHFQDIKRERTLSTFSKSLPLVKGLRPERYEEVEIPLEGLQLKIPLLTVSTFLVYNIPETGSHGVRHNTAGTKLSNSPLEPVPSEKSPLCVLIQQDRLNILDFLYIPSQGQSVSLHPTSSQQTVLYNSDLCTLGETAMGFARQRPSYYMYFSRRRDGQKQPTIHSLMLNLRSHRIPDLEKCRSSEDILPVIARWSSAKVEGTLTRMFSPGGHQITLSVGPDQSGDTTSDQSKSSHISSNHSSYNLTLLGEDLPTLVLVRSGLLQTLSAQMTSGSRKDFDIEEKEIRTVLHQFQRIRKNLDEMPVRREPDGYTGEESTLIGAYEQLRTVSLPYFL